MGTLAKMVADGLTQKVVSDRTVSFQFYDCGKIPPPVIMVQNVSFRYNERLRGSTRTWSLGWIWTRGWPW